MQNLVEALLEQDGIVKMVFGRLIDKTEDALMLMLSADEQSTSILLVPIQEILELTIFTGDPDENLIETS